MPRYTPQTTAIEIAEDCKHQIQGATILVTGVSPGGLGAIFVETLAVYLPKLLVLAGRDEEKLRETVTSITKIAPSVATRVLSLDLASQRHIRAAADEVLSYSESIDVLVNNAGIMACPYMKTTDGLEAQFAINHLGPFLFTNLIMPKLTSALSGARIVNVSSDGHRLSPIRFEDVGFDAGRTYNKWRAYGQAKTANMLFSVELAKRYASSGVVAVSLHPGVVSTNLAANSGVNKADFHELLEFDRATGNLQGWTNLKYVEPQVGIATHMYASFDSSIRSHNGAYCEESRVLSPNEVRCWGRDPVEAELLWKLSEQLVGDDFGR